MDHITKQVSELAAGDIMIAQAAHGKVESVIPCTDDPSLLVISFTDTSTTTLHPDASVRVAA